MAFGQDLTAIKSNAFAGLGVGQRTGATGVKTTTPTLGEQPTFGKVASTNNLFEGSTVGISNRPLGEAAFNAETRDGNTIGKNEWIA